MGTSKAHGTSPQWSKVKSSMTIACGNASTNPTKIGKIISGFVTAGGGARSIATGGSNTFGRAGARTGKQLASLLSAFKQGGYRLGGTFGGLGFAQANLQTPDEIIGSILEWCAGVSATIDDSIAKEALRKLLEEIVGDAENVAEVEENLKQQIEQNDIPQLLIRFFCFYLLEVLSEMFYENLISKKGKTACGTLFRDIKEFIFARVSEIGHREGISSIQVNGLPSEEIINRIQQDVLNVFESHEN